MRDTLPRAKLPRVPWPLLFLLTSLVGAWLTLNALRPSRRGVLVGISFFAAWLTTELALFHLGLQALAAVLFVRMGGLESYASILALGLTSASCIGLAWMLVTARRGAPLIDDALGKLLMDAPKERARIPLRQLVLPFYLRDRRVERIGNLAYGPFGRRNYLDIYRPRRGVTKAPVILQIHGGAWIVGDKRQQGLPLMLHMAARGFVCVAINYRLSPRSTFPDHLIDAKRALAWVRENIEAHGGDPSRIIVTGGSAGGHLAAMVALTANDPAYQPGFEEADTSVLACVPVYAPYDLVELLGPRKGREHVLVERLSRWVMGKTLAEAEEAYREASPMTHVGEEAPPFFVIHGTHDNLVPVSQARGFVEALRGATDAKVAYAELPGAAHAFDVFHSMRTAQVVASIERFASWVARR